MIDHRLLREDPNLIAEGLKSRGMDVDLKPLQKSCKDLKQLEEKRNSLQAQGNSIGKEVGQKIKQGFSQDSEVISNLRMRGNQIKKQVGLIDSIYVQEFNSQYVFLKIKYLGKLDKIIKQLENEKIILKLEGDQWSIKIL